MNVSYACVAAAFLLIYLARVPVGMAMGKAPGGYDNRTPRDQQATLTGWGKRATAAHLNAFESFAPFAAAVLAANAAHVAEGRVTALAVTYVVARVIYTVTYIADIPLGRSAAWVVGMACTGALFVLAVIG